jgi:type II secretory pathway component PulJ
LCLYKDNSGISLVELIITIAIAAIVLSMIAIMINSAANSFRNTNEDVDLQMEAQITMNQLSTCIMEAKSVSVSASGVTTPDLKYIIDDITTYQVVYYLADKERLYLISADTLPDAEAVNRSEVLAGEDQYLMAEYVTGISIDNSDVKTADTVIIFGLGDQTYTTEKKIKLRNAK